MVQVQTLIDECDLYASKVKGFNFEGREKIGSKLGCFFSALVLLSTLTVTIIKFMDLVSNDNPTVTNAHEYDRFNDTNSALTVNTSTFAFAFKVSDFLTDESLDNSSMVRWFAEIVESDGIDYWGQSNRTTVGTHKCTKDDIANFYEPNPA